MEHCRAGGIYHSGNDNLNDKIKDIIINLMYELKSLIPDSSSNKYSIDNLVRLYNYSGICFIKVYLSCDPKVHSTLCSKDNFLLTLLQQCELNNIKNSIIKNKSVITVQDINRVSNTISLSSNKKFDIKMICRTWGVSRSNYYNKLNKNDGLGILFPTAKKIDYINYLFFHNLKKNNRINDNYLSLLSEADNEEQYIDEQKELINGINNYLVNKYHVCYGTHYENSL